MAKNIMSRGWRFHAHGGNFFSLLKLEEFALNNANKVILRMQAAPITQLDLDYIRGFCGALPLPALAGSTGVGIVAAAAGGFKEGDRAVIIGGRAAGAWATQVAIDSAHLIKVPPSLPLDAAATLTIGPIAAYQILKATGLKSGDCLALNGADTLVGKCVAQLAKAKGIAVAVGGQEGAAKAALDLVGGAASGALLSSLQEGGQLLVHVAPSDEAPVLPSAALASKGITVRAFAPLPAVSVQEAEQMVAEVADLLKAPLGLKLVRHDFDKALEGVGKVSTGSPDGLHWLAIN